MSSQRKAKLVANKQKIIILHIRYLFFRFILYYSVDISYGSISFSSTGSTEENDLATVDNTEEKASDYNVAIRKLMQYFVKHRSSFSCLEDTAKLMNSMPGARVQLPVTKYKLLREFMLLNSFNIQYYISCDRCNIYTKCIEEKEFRCSKCAAVLKLREMNYFVYIPVVYQLKYMLQRFWSVIADFKAAIQEKSNQQTISDVYDGEILKKIVSTRKNALSLMISTDGVSLKKSNPASFWPIQVLCNFLPPNLRYCKENIIVAAFFYADSKPDMCDFFVPFVEEMSKLEEEGFIMNDEHFQPIVTHAVFDLPAKAAFSKIKQYNGYYSCLYCFHPGEKTEVGVRYTYTTENHGLRTHESMLATLNDVYLNRHIKDYTKCGVYGISPTIKFNHFDLVHSFAIDHMHCVLIGIVRKLLCYWLEGSHGSHIPKKRRLKLDRRISAIKPCRFVGRLPRSLRQRKYFKATENGSLLLFYLPVCLRDILKTKYFDHFNLLSSSIYTLLKTNISSEELIGAREKLELFVHQYQLLYGKNEMTLNVHSLLHIPSSVAYLGPLWATSMFSFESSNAIFGQYVKGNTDVISQIVTKYAIDKASKKNLPARKNHKDFTSLDVKKDVKLGTEDVRTLRANGLYFERKNGNVLIYCTFKRNEQSFTSISYNRPKKTIDYFVELKNKLIGKIKFYIEHEKTYYFVMEEFLFVENVHHIAEIKPRQIDSIHLVDQIDKKLIYLNYGNQHFITERPNQFESD